MVSVSIFFFSSPSIFHRIKLEEAWVDDTSTYVKLLCIVCYTVLCGHLTTLCYYYSHQPSHFICTVKYCCYQLLYFSWVFRPMLTSLRSMVTLIFFFSFLEQILLTLNWEFWFNINFFKNNVIQDNLCTNLF